MNRTIYYTATSLDGFIADPEESLGWLLSRRSDEDGPMGYRPFIARIGSLAMGATTYRWIQRQEHTWPYSQPCWVFTHGELRPFDGADIRFTTDDIVRAHSDMVEVAGGRDVWVVGGGNLAAQFADHGLLDEVVVSIAPLTLGGGAPLLPRRTELQVQEVAANGEFACVRYTVVRDRPGERGQWPR